jgi:hypothetical protein
MIEMNINEFMALARYHLFGLLPVQQPTLATIPAQQDSRR